MRKKKTKILIILLVTILILGTACQPQPTTSIDNSVKKIGTIKIGAIYPMSGVAAQTGKEYIDAIQLAVDIINNQYDLDLPFAREEGIPSMDGAKIEIMVADHQASPEVGLSEAERLISEEKVHILMGCHYSSVSKTATNVAERLGIPFVIPDSTSKDLTARGYKYVFRTGPHDGTFVHDTFKYLDYLNKDFNAGIKTIAMISEDTEFGALLANEVKALYSKYGYDLVENITYPADSINVTSEVLKLKTANPDAVIMASYTSDAILFIKTYQEQGFMPKAIIGQRAGFIAPELFTALGNLTEGIATTNLWALDLSESNPLVAEVNDLFIERSGVDFTGDYIRAFTAVFAIADALERAGSLEPDVIRQALAETNIINTGQLMVPWEGIKYGEDGQNIYASGIITQAFDGSYRTVWPSANKSTDPVVPLPSWNKR